MDLIVTFMQNFSDSDYLYKNISELYTANCTLLQPCDILQPHFILQYQPQLASCNYVYVPEFRRYYFASVQIENGGRAVIYCNVDPLQSWQREISNLYVNVSNSENSQRTYVPDTRVSLENAIDIQTIAFPFELGNSDFSGVHYMMSVIGGVSSPATGGG